MGVLAVPAMDLIEIDVVGLQASQTLIKLKQDCLARKTVSIGLIAHHAVDFGGDHHGFAPGV